MRYKIRGLNLLTLEKRPSLQKSFGDDLYTSLETGEFRLPIRNPMDLALVILKSLKTLGRLKQFRPIAIYAYNQDPENVVPGLIFKFLLGRPLIIVYHHISRLSFAPFGLGVLERRNKGYGLLSSMWLSLVPALNRMSVGTADVHLALSTSTKREVEAWAGVENCIVVGNGVDTKKFRLIEGEREYAAAFLGRIVPQKGIETLLRAWSLVVLRQPDSRLVLIGGADSSQMSLYRELAKEVGVASSVDFKGFLSDEEVVRTLNSSKMFVFPSLKEGFAQAVSQAMACGLCCLISDIPALRETYDEVAVFVPPSDPRALASKIIAMLANDSELIRCGARSRLFVERFDWGAVVEKELQALIGVAK
ncbi:MAG TPA: glycosyltransferase family 4 protein [Nitrososphaerales archaeon]|nr:glycosyltransferase family 4 protein [Nitrososphaerales archaeon]